MSLIDNNQHITVCWAKGGALNTAGSGEGVIREWLIDWREWEGGDER